MDAALILTFESGDGTAGDALARWGAAAFADHLDKLAAPVEAHLFTPDLDWASVPFFDDGAPPPLIVEIAARLTDLIALAGLAAFCRMLADVPVADCRITAGLFRIVRTPVAGAAAPVARSAPLSFVVRYFAPVPDAEDFRAAYLAGHPALLARLPGVRNVLCYVPLALPGGPWQPSPVVLGNEVVFDDVPALVAALRSDVLADVRAHSRTLPPRGHNTHHAMQRRRIV